MFPWRSPFKRRSPPRNADVAAVVAADVGGGLQATSGAARDRRRVPAAAPDPAAVQGRLMAAPRVRNRDQTIDLPFPMWAQDLKRPIVQPAALGLVWEVLVQVAGKLSDRPLAQVEQTPARDLPFVHPLPSDRRLVRLNLVCPIGPAVTDRQHCPGVREIRLIQVCPIGRAATVQRPCLANREIDQLHRIGQELAVAIDRRHCQVDQEIAPMIDQELVETTDPAYYQTAQDKDCVREIDQVLATDQVLEIVQVLATDRVSAAV